MCPFCIATAAILAGSAAGTGGLIAIAGTILLKKSPTRVPNPIDEEEVRHGDRRNAS